MPDETEATETETPTTPELSTIIGPNGELLEGWKEHLVPEDMRHEPVYNKFTDLKGALKQIGIQDKLVGRKGVLVPNEKSTATEWENFYEATGRPPTKDDYKLPVPEDLKEYYDPNWIAKGRELLFGIGANQKHADIVWKFEEERIRASLKAITEAEAAEKQECEDALKQKWGDAYEERLLFANRIIEENAPGELKQQILERYGNDPIFAEYTYNIGQKFAEHPEIANKLKVSGAMSPGEANTKMKELIATPGYSNQTLKYENPAAYNRIVKEVAALAAIVASNADTP